MDNHEIVKNILIQKENLIKKIPELEHYFIPINIPQWSIAIPFLPIRTFRDFDLHTSYTEETSEKFKIFLSSGSTGNKRSRHIFSQAALENYEKNTCKGFSSFLTRHNINKNTPIISLIPTPTQWPTSSLAAMIEMFAQNKFNIMWFDIESRKENLIDFLAKYPDSTDCLIFGTTFHHLMLANNSDTKFKDNIQAQFRRLNISIVDTGGTKGRTEALTLEQSIQVLKEFYTTPNFSFFSEYGMCELSSQAWSAKKTHDGSFICNETLFPFAISIEKNTILPHGEKGFIGFIDSVNTESWSAIITEDVGYTSSENSFHLIGRGPDASIKGCSLNVRSFFTFSKQSAKKLIPLNRNVSPIELKNIISALSKDYKWDKYSLADFQTIAQSIDEGIPTDNQYKNKNLLIISAANTPIAWLFPYLIATNSGASSITIKIPSLRLDDYYAEKIIEKTQNLIEIFAQYFPNTKTYIDSNKSIAHTFNEYDIVLTFGTNETLQTISEQINPKKTKFIGKGDIKNSLAVNVTKDTPEHIANLCSLWNGRGCLTPVVLFCEGNTQEVNSWATQFAKCLEKEFTERFELNKIGLLQEFAHSHNCAFVRGQIKQLGVSDQELIIRSALTCVVNLTNIPIEKLKFMNLELNFGGCGFVYLLPINLKSQINGLSELDVVPSIGIH